MVKVELEGEQVLERVIRRWGNTAGAQVPVGWVGREVYVILKEDRAHKKKKNLTDSS